MGLTGDIIAHILMVWWDQQIIERLEARGMKVLMYLRYADDINIVGKNMTARVESDKPKYEANMLFVQQIANTIDPSMQVTKGFPEDAYS